MIPTSQLLFYHNFPLLFRQKRLSPPWLQPDCWSFTNTYYYFECTTFHITLPCNQIYYPPIFQHSHLLQSNLSLCSSSPWFQFTAEPSESLLIITLTLESSPLIMPTISFIQGGNMRKPGGCGAFGNDTYSQLAIMVATGNQLHLWIFLLLQCF